MYDIENLTLGTADVVAITPKLIAASFLRVARLKNVWYQFYTPIDISGKAGLQIDFPKELSGVAFEWDIDPGGSATESSMSYDATTIRVKKMGGYYNLYREVLQSGIRDVIKDHLYQGGLVYKESIDTIAYEGLIGPTSTTQIYAAAVGESTCPMANTPVIELTSVNQGAGAYTLVAVDYVGGIAYYNGTLDVDGTINYKYASVATVAVHGIAQNYGTSGGSVTARYMAVGKANLIARGRDPTFAIVKDADIPTLLYDDKTKFIDASAYGARTPLMNMEIGKMWNMRMITTSRELPDGVVVMIDKERVGKWVTKRPLEAHREDKWDVDSVRYYMWSQFNCGVTDDQAICLVLYGTNAYPDTYPAA